MSLNAAHDGSVVWVRLKQGGQRSPAAQTHVGKKSCEKIKRAEKKSAIRNDLNIHTNAHVHVHAHTGARTDF